MFFLMDQLMNDYRILQGVWVAQCMLGSVKLSVNSIFARIGKQKQKQARLNRIILGGGGGGGRYT